MSVDPVTIPSEAEAVEAALQAYEEATGDGPCDKGVFVSDVYSTQEAIDDGLLLEHMPHSFPKIVLSLSVDDAIANYKVKSKTKESMFDLRAHFMRDAVLAVTRRWHNAKNLGMTDVEAEEEVRIMPNCLEGNITDRPVLIALNELGGITIMYPEDF